MAVLISVLYDDWLVLLVFALFLPPFGDYYTFVSFQIKARNRGCGLLKCYILCVMCIKCQFVYSSGSSAFSGRSTISSVLSRKWKMSCFFLVMVTVSTNPFQSSSSKQTGLLRKRFRSSSERWACSFLASCSKTWCLKSLVAFSAAMHSASISVY